MLKKLVEILKADKRTLVFTQGFDPRILEAASKLKNSIVWFSGKIVAPFGLNFKVLTFGVASLL